MLNPYEPPRELQRAPFWKRFRSAWNRGRRAYKAGLVRDKISPVEHIGTWLSAILAGSLILFVIACVLINVLRHYLR